jgi:hypothetical protein
VTPVSSTSTTVLPSTGVTPSRRSERSAFADSDGGKALSTLSSASTSRMPLRTVSALSSALTSAGCALQSSKPK